MAGEVVRRPKASVQKVRTACKTCKIRRVKCDEQKPSCVRCTSTGRNCDGYDPAFTRRMNRLPLGDACANPSAAATRVIYKIPFKIPGSQNDRQLLHYFCVQAAGELEGYSTSDFWTHELLQQSHREPIIRRALIAVASMHQEYVLKGTRGSNGDKINTLTLLEYNKAVRQLRKYLASTANPCRAVILFCCVLFYCFETARGEYGAAMEHLRAGLVILKSWIEEKGIPYSASDLARSSDVGLLMQTFARMDLQASIFDDSRLPFLRLASPDERAGKTSCVPLDFARLSDVQVTLDKLQSWLFHFLVSNLDYKFAPMEDIPDSVIREKAELEKQFSRWSSALNAFVKSDRFTRSQSTERSVKLLVMLHRGLCILVQASLLTPDPVDKDYDADFNVIVTLAEEISSCPNQEVNEDRRSFTFETGVVAPLSLIIAKCRDPRLRQRALSVLATSPRREGLIDGELVIRIAERLIEFEESDAPLMVSHGVRSLEESVSAAAAMDVAPGIYRLSEYLEVQDEERPGMANAASGTHTDLGSLSSVKLWGEGWEGIACLRHMEGVPEHNTNVEILGMPVPVLGIPCGTGFRDGLGKARVQVNSTTKRS